MEGKTVILSVVIMTLVMAQIQVEATSLCCPSADAKYCFGSCGITGAPKSICLQLCECEEVSGNCPPRYPVIDSLKKSAQGDAVNEYCKLGCGFSLCGAMTTLQNDANEIVTGAVEQCTKVCSTICNKGSLTAVESTA